MLVFKQHITQLFKPAKIISRLVESFVTTSERDFLDKESRLAYHPSDLKLGCYCRLLYVYRNYLKKVCKGFIRQLYHGKFSVLTSSYLSPHYHFSMFDFFLIAWGILVRVRTTSIRRAILANKSKGLKKLQSSLFLLEHLARKDSERFWEREMKLRQVVELPDSDSQVGRCGC